jgi:hypothetical protein
VIKLVNLVKPDKFGKVVNAVLDKSNAGINVDREISKLVIEVGKLGNVKSPEGVVKFVKLVNPDKSDKPKPVNPTNPDKSNAVKDVDLETSKNLNEGGKLEAVNSVSPEEVTKDVNPVNPDKSGKLVIPVDLEISKLIREEDN